VPENSPFSLPDQGEPGLDQLVMRMRAGDREAVGAFLGLYGPLIRRRARGKLHASLRRIYDSQDILSTVGRRLDACVRDRKLTAESEGEFWSFVFRTVQNSLIEKSRLVDSLCRKEGEDSEFAASMLRRMREGEKNQSDDESEVDLTELLAALPSDTDRTITTLWCMGLTHPQIAEHLDLPHDHVRKRWQRARAILAAALEQRRDEAHLPARD